MRVGRAADERGVALFGHAACCFVASRTVSWGCCSAEQLVDQGAAPLGVVQERGVAPWHDLEVRVGDQRCGPPADLRAAVGVLGVRPGQGAGPCE
jgi:hypothetical protein